ENGAKDLFLRDARLRADAGDYGGLDEVAVGSFRRAAARDEFAFLLPYLDVVEDGLHRGLVDHWSHKVVRVLGRADFNLGDALLQLLTASVVNLLGHDRAGARRALLPRIAEGRSRHASHRRAT